MIDPHLDERRRFRLSLGSALLFFSVSLIVLGGLVWYFAEWGLDTVDKAPAFDDGKPFQPWHFLAMVFLASMIAPLVGLGFDPLLRHLAVRQDIAVSPPLAVAVALPFWYVSFLPTYLLSLNLVDSSTRTLLFFAPAVCALLTGALHLVMVHYVARSLHKD